ncbi:hypothetical protein [Streptomyces sp. WAC08241]|uniref:hypothetical protein n=1 Tax=Streptomyces sp. WAC08241 TaxID=2487421 RepID=UPI00163D0D1F|nr:hypothetical protein [Streptomyces sp. WAC08241]
MTRPCGQCPTGKRRYYDRIRADIVLARIQRSNNPHRQEKRVYRCRTCRGWHLTSRPFHRKQPTP